MLLKWRRLIEHYNHDSYNNKKRMPCQLLSLYNNQYIKIFRIRYLSLQHASAIDKTYPEIPNPWGSNGISQSHTEDFRVFLGDPCLMWSMRLFGVVSFMWMCPMKGQLVVQLNFFVWDSVIFWKLILWLFAVVCLQIDIWIMLLETGYTHWNVHLHTSLTLTNAESWWQHLEESMPWHAAVHASLQHSAAGQKNPCCHAHVWLTQEQTVIVPAL